LSGPIRKVVTGITFFFVVCVIAVIGYVAAGWQVMDSVYMVIITIFGVGYGEVQPVQSPHLRALTIGVIVAGYGAVIYTVGGFVQMLIDGELNRALGARRMTKGIDKLENHTIICGFGRVGSILARELKTAGKQFIVIDINEELIRQAESHDYLVIHGNATDESILRKAGIMRAKCLASVLSDDAENVFITITAHYINLDLRIIARGERPSTEKKLLHCGASEVVLPSAIGARQISHMIARPSAENLLRDTADHQFGLNDELGKIGLQFDELQVPAGSTLIGKPIADIEIRGNHGFLVVALRRQDGTVLLSPDESECLRQGDTVIVIGRDCDLPQLASRYTLKREVRYRGATIEM
jgi:voltage-gated potassium channel